MAVKTALVGAGVASLALAHPGHGHQKRGTIPVDGTIWTSCVTPGVVALTFDDGPYQYTASIVQQLTTAGHRATFFQNGQNWDSIYNYNSTLQAMIAGGHQIASHTWSHADLATLDAAGITDQMGELEAAHLAIIGKAPTYMRPPYLSTNDLAITTLKGLGYKIIEVDIDTQDWAEGPIGDIDLSIQWYEGNQTAGGTISLNHDPYQPTAETFLPAIISYLAGKGLKSVPVGECLGDDPANWYRGGSATVSSSAAPASSSAAPASSSGAPAASSSAVLVNSSGAPPASSSAAGPGPSGSASPSASGSKSGSPSQTGSGPAKSSSPASSGSSGSGSSGSGSSGSSSGSGSSGSGSGSPGKGGYTGTGQGLPAGPKSGGDTEGGHGPGSGHAALPPCGGGQAPVNGGKGSASAGASGPGWASNSSSTSHPVSSPLGASGSATNATGYYYNSASTMGYSSFALGAAALALFM